MGQILQTAKKETIVLSPYFNGSTVPNLCQALFYYKVTLCHRGATAFGVFSSSTLFVARQGVGARKTEGERGKQVKGASSRGRE